MNSNWLAKFSGLATLLTVAVGASAPVNAQHHHHDRAGHMVDDAGHHVNGYGQHTGVGVYENYGYQQPYTYQQPYVYQQPVYQQQHVQNVVPTNVVPYPIQSSVGMIANGGTIKILNPAESGGEIKYTLNGTAYRSSRATPRPFRTTATGPSISALAEQGAMSAIRFRPVPTSSK